MWPGRQPFFLFREEFAILSYDPFKTLIPNKQSNVSQRRKGAHLPAQYSQHIGIFNFKNSSSSSLPAYTSKLSSGQNTILSRREFVRKREMMAKG